jgi:preprotein translocase subunit Sss1
MIEFNEFIEIFMVVGIAIHSIHAVGMAIRSADQLAICHPNR